MTGNSSKFTLFMRVSPKKIVLWPVVTFGLGRLFAYIDAQDLNKNGYRTGEIVQRSVLQIGHYPTLLETRSSMLESDGYKVTSALGNQQGMAAAHRTDVVVVGFSGPLPDRLHIRWLKLQLPSTPVVALLANSNEKFPDADLVTFSENPRDWLITVVACARKYED